jgi:hypothetical protein
MLGWAYLIELDVGLKETCMLGPIIFSIFFLFSDNRRPQMLQPH